MSRFLVAASLFTALTVFGSFASADQVGPRFAQPPSAAPAAGAPARAEEAPFDIPDRAQVRAKLAAARATNLARFRAYQKAGVFPSNTFTNDKLNVWRDADGHLCAAATIINASGQSALVQRVADQNNFIRLADVSQGPLMDWILTSGLTQAEIAAIQEPFMGVGEPEPADPIMVRVDPAKRAAEDKRLLARYRQVDRQIVRDQKKSLDAATDRLMKNPVLAWSFANR